MAASSNPTNTKPDVAAVADAKQSGALSAVGTNAFVAHALQLASTSTSTSTSSGKPRRKASIVGCGAVGCAVASSLLAQRLCSELCLIDVVDDKLQAEVADFRHGMGASHMPVAVYGGSDLALTRDSQIVFVAAGVRQRPGESRRELLNRNAKLLTPVFRAVSAHSPDGVVCVISNPVDAMTFLATRVCALPPGRVFGSGTILDSSRFRLLVAERLALPITAVHAHVVGEHGDASVPLWSSVNVFGTPLRTLFPAAGTANDPSGFTELGARVVNAAMDLIKAKGYTSWGIGLCGAAIARAVLGGEPAVIAVTTVVPANHVLCAPVSASTAAGTCNASASGSSSGSGHFKLAAPVAMSLPCEVGAGGVKAIMKVSLDSAEAKALQATANKLLELQDMIDLPAEPMASTAAAAPTTSVSLSVASQASKAAVTANATAKL